jgi:hypothetical protein
VGVATAEVTTGAMMATVQAEVMTGAVTVTVMVTADAMMALWSCQCHGGSFCFKVWGG